MAKELVRDLETAFHPHRNSSLALKQSAYMQNLFPFLGLPKPLRSQLEKPLFKRHPLSGEALYEAILLLWEKEEREFQYSALSLIGKRPLPLSLTEHLIRTHPWWDTVDLIASTHLPLHPQMDEWILDPCLWIRRSALLFQLRLKEKTDSARLFRYIELVAHEKEFFIRKAIGWALREYSKTDPSEVKKFVTSASLSPLSRREASKYLPA